MMKKQFMAVAMADIHVPLCSIVAIDTTSICYRVCGSCERVLPAGNSSYDKNAHPCAVCRRRPRNPSVPVTKHLYKLLMSIVTDKCAMVVVVFDRAARILFGCPADDFLQFSLQNSSAVEMASKVLKGEMLSLVLRPPKGVMGSNYVLCPSSQFLAHSNLSWLVCLNFLPQDPRHILKHLGLDAQRASF